VSAGASDDARFMRHALALAERGRGTTRPNPVVGAVVVRGGKVVGEGFHLRAGEPHAEVHALRAAGDAAHGATLYVNLEPCAHTGRTGPCTEAIIASRVARVVVGCRDPNPRVDGRGMARLRRAGIRVDDGVLEAECRATNRAFAVWVEKRRPLVTLKAAATLDGFIADRARRARRAPVWITGPAARLAAHELRAAHDAVLVGAGTVLADDPQLTVRLARGARGNRGPGRGESAGPAPLRVVLDGRLRTPAAARVLGRGAPTLIVTGKAAPAARARALEAAGAEVLRLPGRARRPPLARVLAELAARDVQSILVEGGAEVLGSFIESRLVDRVALFVAPTLLGGGIPIATGAGLSVAQALHLGALTARHFGDDLLLMADVVER
jgi:diaminohydroxyphosphoribosylaminopyrimidine deaminase/5-amino-6-(5-phosphoribosylamino)uracil reductase